MSTSLSRFFVSVLQFRLQHRAVKLRACSVPTCGAHQSNLCGKYSIFPGSTWRRHKTSSAKVANKHGAQTEEPKSGQSHESWFK